MTQALGIGASSVNADMTAIDALAENIANAQTPGYVSENVNLSAIPGGAIRGVGSGVEVTSITQATNALLAANNWQAQGALSNLSALQESLSAIENVFPLATQPGTASTGSTASASISGQLSTFWSAWDAIAANPSSQAPRVEVLDDAQALVTALHEASEQLTQIAQNAVAELTGQVGQVNTLLAQVANINQSIVAVSGSSANTAPLEDQLQAAIATLSQLAGVEVRMQSNGTATVSIGGIAVVQGGTASTLALVPTAPAAGSTAPARPPLSVQVQVSPEVDLPAPVSSGSIAGLLSSVNTYVPTAQGLLDTVATALATTVNTMLAGAHTASGSAPATSQMFLGGSSASTIEVNSAFLADPASIPVSKAATATTGRAAANTGAIAMEMAELGTTPNGPDSRYQTLVQSVGAIAQSVNNQMEAQTAVATQAKQALQAVTGVDVTDDLTALISFQQNYEASARVLSTVDGTVQALLQAV